jgi:predicted transcriptional regulator
MINRAIFDRLIKKKIMLVEDLVGLKSKPYSLKATSTAEDFRRVAERTGENSFPVTDEWNRVLGIVSRKDIESVEPGHTIERAMVRSPVTAGMLTSLASAAQIMTWEGIDFLPVVDRNRKLAGVLTRREVLQAMRDAREQSSLGETFDHLIWNGFAEERDADGRLFFHGFITPQMATDLGTISEGIMTSVMIQAALRMAKDHSGNDYVVDNMSTYFIRPVQIEDAVSVMPIVLEVGRRICRLEIAISHEEQTVAKAMMTLHSIENG